MAILTDSHTTQLKAKSSQGFLALQMVTASCHGIRNTFIHPTTSPAQDWYPGLSNDLDTAKGHAQYWIDTLGPQISSTIPRHMISFNSEFDSTAGLIIGLLSKSSSSAQDVKDALDLFGGLVGTLEDIVKAFGKAKTDLTKFQETLQGDHNKLDGSAGSIQKALAADKARIDTLTGEIGHLSDDIDFYNKQLLASYLSGVAGLFIFIVGVAIAFIPGGQVAGAVIMGAGILATAGGTGGAIAWNLKIKQAQEKITKDQGEIDAEKQQIIALNGLSASVKSVMKDISTATQYLSDVQTMWNTVQGTLDDVVTDLKKPNAQLSTIVDKQKLISAQNNWRTCKEFAEGLVGLPVGDKKQLEFPRVAS